jgi:hypothetical protein
MVASFSRRAIHILEPLGATTRELSRAAVSSAVPLFGDGAKKQMR